MNQWLSTVGNKGLNLGRIAGIQVNLDWSLFIVAFLLMSTWSSSLVQAGVGAGLALFMALLAALGLYGSILAHEFGHALTARRFGIGTESINLHILGGVARLLGEARTPRQEFLIAAAGPAVSLALAGLFAILSSLLSLETPSVLALVCGWLGTTNLILGLFNLIPGFPLDGGRILRAALWAKRGSWASGTLLASRIGNGIGMGMCILGILWALSGTIFNGLVLVAIGWMVIQAAAAEGARAAWSTPRFGFRRPPTPTETPAKSAENQGFRVVQTPSGRTLIIDD